MKNVCLHEDILRAEGGLVEGLPSSGNFACGHGELLSHRQPFVGDLDAIRKELAGKGADVATSLEYRFLLLQKLVPELRIVFVQVERLMTLKPSREERFAQMQAWFDGAAGQVIAPFFPLLRDPARCAPPCTIFRRHRTGTKRGASSYLDFKADPQLCLRAGCFRV